jgi:hypothetical protein
MARRALLLGRNGGNGPLDASSQLQWCCRYDLNGTDPDRLAECDVRRMRDALRACDYEHVQVAGHEQDTEGAVIDLIKAELRRCAQSDSFLFYFSGHLYGLSQAPQLVLSGDPCRELLTLRRLIELLQDRQVAPAANKLVILDCCYADRFSEVWQRQAYDGVHLLLATRWNQTAKEVSKLQGGVFTHCLHDALTNPWHWYAGAPAPLVDAGGTIDSAALIRWLEHRVKTLWPLAGGTGSPPEPIADSARDEPFGVATVQHDDTGWPADLLRMLAQAIDATDPNQERCASAYQACVALADVPPLMPLPDWADRSWMLGQLLQSGHYSESSRLQVPLYTFIEHLAEGLERPKPLSDWLAKADAWLEQKLGIERRVTEPAESAQPQAPKRARPDPYLFVRLDPDPCEPEHIQVSWQLFADVDALEEDNDGVAGPLPQHDHTGIARAIACAAAVALRRSCMDTPRIEVLLPFDLLSNDDFVDTLERSLWEGATMSASAERPPDRLWFEHLAADFPLVLCCHERLVGSGRNGYYGGKKLGHRWMQAQQCRHEPPVEPCVAWLPAAGDLVIGAQRLLYPDPPKRAALGLCSSEPIDAPRLAAVLKLGVPVLLWPRRRAPCETARSALEGHLRAQRQVANLPAALLAHRCWQIGCELPDLCDFSLLWDDPNRPHIQALRDQLTTTSAFG